MIKYLGSKRLLLDLIGEAVGRVAPGPTVLDLFSGTSRVGHALKRRGFRVVANDHNAYAHTLARCYVETDLSDVEDDARRLIAEFNRLPGRPGYFTETFCERSRFFQPKNGARIDAIREAIAAQGMRSDRGGAARLPDGGGRPGRFHDRRADGLSQAVGTAGLQRP
jgi:adenine-specific DNA-methyltransferase